jgi:hypothetical protein
LREIRKVVARHRARSGMARRAERRALPISQRLDQQGEGRRRIGWTGDGLLRHTVFVGLRSDKPAIEVRRELPRKD